MNELAAMTYVQDHPNIVRQFGFVPPTSSCMIFSMDLAHYGNLDHLLSDTNNFPNVPLELNIAWLYDIISALKHLHSLGIKYREPKPSDILVHQGFHLKMTSFGLAKHHENRIKDSFSGGRLFCAPETKDARKMEFSSDLYSYALIAVMIFTRESWKTFEAPEILMDRAIKPWKAKYAAARLLGRKKSSKTIGETKVIEGLFGKKLANSKEEASKVDALDRMQSILARCSKYDESLAPTYGRPESSEVEAEMKAIMDNIGDCRLHLVSHPAVDTMVVEAERISKVILRDYYEAKPKLSSESQG